MKRKHANIYLEWKTSVSYIKKKQKQLFILLIVPSAGNFYLV